MLPELRPHLGPYQVVLRWFRRLGLILGLRKPKHAGKKYGYHFRCQYCINHALWIYDYDEFLEYVRSHNRLYHYLKEH